MNTEVMLENEDDYMMVQEKFCALTLESTKLAFEKGFVFVNAVLQCEHDVKRNKCLKTKTIILVWIK